MRRVAWGLGSLARNAGLLALTGIIGFAASSGAAATAAPSLFRLSISGTTHQEWSYTAVPVQTGNCESTIRSEAIRNVRLRTARPVVVRIAAGRVLPVDVRGLTGTVTLSGANTISEVCGGEHRETIQDCVTSKRPFQGGSVGLVSPRAGSITVTPVRNVRLQRVDCPSEPPDLLRTPLGTVPGPLRVSVDTLANPRITHITLTASASRRKNYAAPERGTLQQRSDWTLTFTRIRP